MIMINWKNAPKLSPKMTNWRPGEARSYIPVVNFGVPMNMPAGGLLGKTVSMDGTKRVSFVVNGEKTQGTKARKPGDTK
jgi:hypothetical protein